MNTHDVALWLSLELTRGLIGFLFIVGLLNISKGK
jgi:hypothetical protein